MSTAGFPHNVGNMLRLAMPCACCLLLSCQARQETGRSAEAARNIAELSAGPLNHGNNSQAWLSSSGGAGDSNYCAARLRYPLDPEPAWGWEFTAGSFTPQWVAGLTHYDGRIYLTGYSPNLACLDAGSGAEIFNSFLNPPPKANTRQGFGVVSVNRNLRLSGQFIHPAGQLMLLMGLDGEPLLYDLSGSEPAFIWQGDRLQQRVGYLMADSGTCIGGQDSMNCRDFDGTLRWSQQTQEAPDGNVLSASGILFTRNGGRDLWANRLTDGALLWSLSDASSITGMCVDDNLGCLYVTYFDERVDALALEDGNLLWSYDFSYLLDGFDRAGRLEAVNTSFGLDERSGYPELVLDNVALVVMPDSLVLASEFGKLLCLNHDGSLRWQREDLPPISLSIGFENAILIEEFWYPLELASFNLIGRLSALTLGDTPDWELIQQNIERIRTQSAEQEQLRILTDIEEMRQRNSQMSAEFRESGEPLQVLYCRLELIKPQDGSSLYSMELPRWIRNGVCPAGDKLVFEDSEYSIAYYMEKAPDSHQRQVQAYNWLEPGGDS